MIWDMFRLSARSLSFKRMSMTNFLSTSIPKTLPTLNPSLIAELLADSPRPLIHAQAELIILDGQYLLHYRNGDKTQYKFLSNAAVRHAFAHSSIDSGWLPPGVVRWGSGEKGEWIIQFSPSSRHTLLFASEQKPIVLNIPMPGLVFMGYGRDYYLWAVKGKQFDKSAIAYHAPLPNIDSNGRICFGSNTVPRVSPTGITEAWTLFLNSPFNRDHANNKSRRYPDSVMLHLQEVYQQCKKKYPYRDLIPVSKDSINIDQLVEQRLKY